MPTVISSRVTTQQTVNNDSIYVTPAGLIERASGDAIVLTGTSFATVAGPAITLGAGAAALYGQNGTATATVSQGGLLSSFGSSADAMVFNSTSTTVFVAGYVQAQDFGIGTFAANGDNNFDLTITDTGVVRGGSEVEETAGYSAAVAGSVASSMIFNGGTIIADVNVVTGYRLALINGAFDSTTDNKVSPTSDFSMHFTNTGDVLGDIFLAAGSDRVDNAGFINGTVDMGRDADVYDGDGGQVNGDILLGGGSDRGFGGAFDDTILGGTGNDTIVGRGGADSLLGQNGNDTLRGGDGEDDMSGGEDNDLLRGNDGDDFLNGDGGSDDLRGGSGDDVLFGGSGSSADTLKGGSGNDDLNGEKGRDLLIGGSGDDTLLGSQGADTMTGGRR